MGLVNKLLEAATIEGTGHKYLISTAPVPESRTLLPGPPTSFLSVRRERGKTVPLRYRGDGPPVLDDQLQDTIWQFEHADGVSGASITKRATVPNRKSSPTRGKLAADYYRHHPDVPVRAETIENSVSLKQRKYAVIADEATPRRAVLPPVSLKKC